jgi:membrane protease YdiL (CAAX protease family)
MFRGDSSFFLSQRIGRWRWVWLLASLPAAGLAVVLVTALLFEAVEIAGFGWAEDVSDHLNSESEAATTRPSLLAAEQVFIGMVFWAGAVVGSVVHGRPVRSLVAPVRAFDWSVVRRVLVLQTSLSLVLAAPMIVLPWLGRPTFASLSWSDVAWFLPLALLTVLQTSGEDVFFKGYLLRQFGAATRVFWFAPTIVIIFFVSLHIGNADLQDHLWMLVPLFVLSEAMIVYLIMRTGGMEVALTWHWLNNTWIILFIAERATQANDATLFVFDEDQNTIVDDVVGNGLYVVFLAVQFLAFIWRRSPFYLAPHTWTPAEPETTADPTEQLEEFA